MQSVILQGRILNGTPTEISNRLVRPNTIEHTFVFEDDLEFISTLIENSNLIMGISYINDEVFIYEFGTITKINDANFEMSFFSFGN